MLDIFDIVSLQHFWQIIFPWLAHFALPLVTKYSLVMEPLSSSMLRIKGPICHTK